MSSHELLLNNNTEFDIIQTAKTFQPVMATKTRSWLVVIYFCKDRNVSKNKEQTFQNLAHFQQTVGIRHCLSVSESPTKEQDCAQQTRWCGQQKKKKKKK